MRSTPPIRKIFRGAPSVKQGWLTLLGQPNGLAYSRFSCTVRRGACPSAVKRNQMKRWLREAFRLNQEKLPRGIDWMAVVAAPPEERSFKEITKRFLGLAQQPER